MNIKSFWNDSILNLLPCLHRCNYEHLSLRWISNFVFFRNYCRSGSISPVACREGSFQPKLGQSRSYACKNCPAGSYCPRSGLASAVPCPDGFVCPSGTIDLGQAKRQCPRGYYCRGGKKKSKCPKGSYQARVWYKFPQNVPRCPEMSQNVKMSQNIPKMSQNVRRCPQITRNDPK